MINETEPDNNEYMRSRLGFDADVLINVVGTSFDNRQRLLRKAKNFCDWKNTPPCFLKREPDNQYDAGAVAVYAGVDYDNEQGWDLQHVGYLPKNWEIQTRDPNTGALFKTKKKVWKIMDEGPGDIEVAMDGIYEQAGNRGMRLGVRHRVEVKMAHRLFVFTGSPDAGYPVVGGTKKLIHKGHYVFLKTDSSNQLLFRGPVKGTGGQSIANFHVKQDFFQENFNPIMDTQLAEFILEAKPELLG